MAATEPALSTREAIVIEARRCFAENGYDGTSLNDIAAAVGLRRPSLLHHFPSKEAIYVEVFRITLEEWGTRVEGAIEQQMEGWQQVDLVITTGFRFFQENPEFVRFVRREALDGGAHLGIDLGQALRPFGASAALMISDIPFLEGLLDGDPLAPDALETRLEHLRSLFRVSLAPTSP